MIPSQYRHTRTTRECHKNLQMGIKDDLDRCREISIFWGGWGEQVPIFQPNFNTLIGQKCKGKT